MTGRIIITGISEAEKAAKEILEHIQAIDVLGALEPGRAYIIRSVFERILQDAGYSTAAMISYLKQESLIETRGRANTKGKRINGIPTECFCLRLPTVELDDEEDPDELPL